MPVVQVHLNAGRSEETKKKLAAAIVDAMVNIAGSTREGVYVIFDDVPKGSFITGRALMAEEQAKQGS